MFDELISSSQDSLSFDDNIVIIPSMIESSTFLEVTPISKFLNIEKCMIYSNFTILYCFRRIAKFHL